MRRRTLNPGGLDLVYGLPREANTTTVAIADTPASGFMEPEKTYRVIATKDCYVDFIQLRTASVTTNCGPVTTSGVFLQAGVPEFFSTDTTYSGISVLRKSENGTLFVTQMEDRR